MPGSARRCSTGTPGARCRTTRAWQTSSLNKLVARYTQYEAVNLIVDRVKDPDRRKGLIYHT